MNLYLLRHCITDENEKRTYYGTLDPSLNKKGILQCEEIKEYLDKIDFSKVYTSSKLRTMETSKAVVPHLQFEVSKDLDERDFGIFEGKSYDELQNNVKYNEFYKDWNEDWINFKIPNGESHMEFTLRVYKFIEELLKVTNDNENVLLITHAGVIRLIYTYVMDKNTELFWKFSSSNGDLSLIKYEFNNLYIDYIMHFKEQNYE